MNNALYEIASVMVMRESLVWRWSHPRHHSDTTIVGRDPEICCASPGRHRQYLNVFPSLKVYPKNFRRIVMHCFGRVSAEERTFIPEIEFPKLFSRARIYVGLYVAVITLSLYLHGILPLMLVGLTNLYGTWLMVVYGLAQQAGLDGFIQTVRQFKR